MVRKLKALCWACSTTVLGMREPPPDVQPSEVDYEKGVLAVGEICYECKKMPGNGACMIVEAEPLVESPTRAIDLRTTGRRLITSLEKVRRFKAFVEASEDRNLERLVSACTGLVEYGTQFVSPFAFRVLVLGITGKMVETLDEAKAAAARKQEEPKS